MGNNLVYPTVTSRSSMKIEHYSKCTITQVAEAFTYFTNSPFANTALLDYAGFEDVFGNLMDDTELQYEIFHNSSSITHTFDIFFVFGLLGSESLKNKLHLLFEMNKENRKKFRIENIIDISLRVARAIEFAFDVHLPSKTNIIKYLEDSLQRYQQRKQLEIKEKVATNYDQLTDLKSAMKKNNTSNSTAEIELISSSSYITFEDVWEWSLDIGSISSLLQAVQSHILANENKIAATKKFNSLGKLLDDDLLEAVSKVDISKLDDDDGPLVYRQSRHPLWNYTVLNFVDESWYDNHIEISLSEKAFIALEYLALSDRIGLPVYIKNSEAKSPTNRNRAILRDPFPVDGAFFGVFDHFSMISWIIHNSPKTVYEKIKEDEELLLKQKQLFDLSSVSIEQQNDLQLANSVFAESSSRDSIMAKSLDDNNTIVMLLSANSSKLRERSARDTHNTWHQAGELSVHSTVSELLDSFYLERRKQHNLPVSDIQTMEQFLYNIVDMYAVGYPFIPVAYSMSTPKNVSHILSGIDIAKFLRDNGNDVLGKFQAVKVMTSGLVKAPITISHKQNLGSALYLLVVRNADSMVVLDANEKVGAVLRAGIVNEFWKVWIEQSGKYEEQLVEEIIEKYRNGNHIVNELPTGSSYSIFSSLLSPLTHCETLGVTITDFNHVFGIASNVENDRKISSRNNDKISRGGNINSRVSNAHSRGSNIYSRGQDRDDSDSDSSANSANDRKNDTKK